MHRAQGGEDKMHRAQGGAAATPIQVAQIKTLEFADLAQHLEAKWYPVERAALSDSGWSLADNRQQHLLDKLRQKGVPLGEYVNGRIYRGILTGLNEAFVIDAAKRKELIEKDPKSAEIIKPFLAGRDIKRYEQPKADKYLILIPNGWTRGQLAISNPIPTPIPSPLHGEIPTPIPSPLHGEGSQTPPLYEVERGQGGEDKMHRAQGGEDKMHRTQGGEVDDTHAWEWFSATYPAIAEHLTPFATKAKRRTDQGEFWWELRPCSYYDAFEQPKLIFTDISLRGSFIYDESGSFYTVNTCYIMPANDKFLLGVLNSSLISYIYRKLSPEYRGGYLRFIHQYMVQIPIPKLNLDNPAEKTQHDALVNMVEKMLKLKQDHAAAEAAFQDKRFELAEAIQRLDAQIDALVYQLYGLTPEEIALVAGQ